MNTLKLTIIACGFIFFLSCGDSSQKQTNAPANNSKAAATSPQAAATPAADVASGAKLYAANCQICHQNTGKGGKNLTVGGKKLSPEDLTADKFKKHSDDALVEHISEGVPDEGMPSFKDKLKPEEIKLIVEHIRTLQGGSQPPA